MSTASRLRESALRALRNAGWAGIAGGLLILIAVAVDQAAGGALDARRATLAAERAALLRGGSATPASGAAASREALDAFYAGFPPAGDLPMILGDVHAHAENHGVDLDRTDYRLADESGTPLLRVALNLPVRGDFRALYAWLGELSAAVPAVGFEALSVRRSDPQLGFIEGELRMVVFVRRERS